MCHPANRLHSLSSCLPVFMTLLALLPLPSAQAADSAFCEHYARDMISVPHAREGTPKTCDKNQPHWNTDKAAQIKACQGMSQAEANKKRYTHNKLVNLCNDTYKIIMLDRKRVASLPLSADENREMQPAPAALKDALLTSAPSNPYRTLYPAVQQALQAGKLKDCEFYSLPVDMDADNNSKEWVITTDASCLASAANTEANTETPHLWLIQQHDKGYSILFEGQHHTLTVRYTTHNAYRNLSIASPLSKQEETRQRCGSIIAEWHYDKGRYIPFKGQADEHGDCLPEYNLPDTLQGANTLDMPTEAWQKSMEQAEKKRISLMAPYKKALQDYIPEWIAKMQHSIAASASAHTAQTPEQKKQTALALPDSGKGGKDDNDSQDQQAAKDKPHKSFLDSVRAFLGLDD